MIIQQSINVKKKKRVLTLLSIVITEVSIITLLYSLCLLFSFHSFYATSLQISDKFRHSNLRYIRENFKKFFCGLSNYSFLPHKLQHAHTYIFPYIICNIPKI